MLLDPITIHLRNIMLILTHEQSQDRLTLFPRGNLVNEDIHQFYQYISPLMAQDNLSEVIVDGSSLSFVDSTGMGAILALHKQLSARDVQFKVLNLREFVYGSLVRCKLNHIVDIRVANETDVS